MTGSELPQRRDLAQRVAEHHEDIRRMRRRLVVGDTDYVLTDSDFQSQTIGGTLYGWQTAGFSARPLRFTRYGNLITVTGTFKRLWTADGSTPGGYTAALGQVLNSTNIPQDVVTTIEGFRIPIFQDVNVSQQDATTVFLGEFGAGAALNFMEQHVDYATYVGIGAPQVPKRRTVYFMVNFTVPFDGVA